VSPRSYLQRLAAAPVWEQAALAADALAVYPGHPQFLLILGRGLYYQAHYRGARRALEDALAAAPPDAALLRGACQLSLAILDAHEPAKRQDALGRLRELLRGEDLTPADRLFARHAAVRLAVSLRRLEEDRAHVRWLRAQEPRLDQTAKEMVLLARLELLLAEGRAADAAPLLPHLHEAGAPLVRFHGILASILWDLPAELEAAVPTVVEAQLPGNMRGSFQALRVGLAGGDWLPYLSRQLQEFPYDPHGYLVGAWLARGEGRQGWASCLQLYRAQLPLSLWCSPAWGAEVPQ